ncbi:mitochondrial 54S ribosomal protein mL59 [Kwoniella dejecticola CBS 10117]|uniref:Large ribosomal subunit protein mL59 domain-containing protein n=1 Tax=Kwoniella dejecticola CBS 10117 TaxID=1296121 RepID=A0A1A5ZUG8_9TREE|nr:uncharacterized protein I303_08222 [Kwoniella dejecticola CBS 10117]OBR81452.1 hypothetical protein I303_08222 [Kwoniella dejecticola CBS 10117]
MSSITRRLFSSSSITRSTAFENTLPLDLSSPVHAKHLPRVLQRRIAKRIFQHEGDLPSTLNMQNPFLPQRLGRRSDSDITGEPRYHWKKSSISNRRQKQLLQSYPSIDLPISLKSPVGAQSRPVKWNTGTGAGGRSTMTIHWTGQLPQKQVEKQIAAETQNQIPSSSTTSEPLTTATKGLYSGRKQMFKGHKDERNREQKLQDRQVRLDGMEKRIREWRQGRNDEKIRNRPSLPF